MGLYDATFRNIDAFERRWSPIHVVGAIVTLCAAICGIAYLGANLGELTAEAREASADSALVRARMFGGLGPFVVMCSLGVLAVLCIHYLFTGARPWHLRGGPRLRRRYQGFHAGDASTRDAVWERFKTGDPAVYTSLPFKVDGGDVDITIWTADAARYGLVGVTYGQAKRRTQTASPLIFEGEHYDALDAALRDRKRLYPRW